MAPSAVAVSSVEGSQSVGTVLIDTQAEPSQRCSSPRDEPAPAPSTGSPVMRNHRKSAVPSPDLPSRLPSASLMPSALPVSRTALPAPSFTWAVPPLTPGRSLTGVMSTLKVEAWKFGEPSLTR